MATRNEIFMEEIAAKLGISKLVVEDVITTVFNGVKEDIDNLEEPMNLMFKYLGKFKILSGKIKALSNIISKQKELGVITEEEFNRKSKLIKDYESIKRNERDIDRKKEIE